MRIPREYRQHWDWTILLTAAALVAVGILAVYSATHHPESARHGYIVRHMVSVGIGAFAFAVMLFIPLRLWEDTGYGVYILSLLMLIAVLLLGVEEYGARRWLRIGFLRFQPAELAKLAVIMAIARYLSGKRVDLTRTSSQALVLGMAAVPGLLVLKQPDLGTAGSFIAIALLMLMWGGIPKTSLLLLLSPVITLALVRHWWAWGIFLAVSAVILWRVRFHWVVVGIFVLLQGALFLGAPMAVQKLRPYQQARITAFLNPEADPSGTGYQVLQSKIALGSGQIVGKGYLRGTQSSLAFLPQQHTDFIYSVVGEEWGFVGGTAVLVLFAVLLARGIIVARNSRSPFSGFLAVGICGMIFYHAVLNMAMTMGMFPVTGLPLPFISYGGSFLLTSLAAVGLMLNVSVHRYDY